MDSVREKPRPAHTNSIPEIKTVGHDRGITFLVHVPEGTCCGATTTTSSSMDTYFLVAAAGGTGPAGIIQISTVKMIRKQAWPVGAGCLIATYMYTRMEPLATTRNIYYELVCTTYVCCVVQPVYILRSRGVVIVVLH